MVVVGLLVDCKSGAGILSGEAGLEGFFDGEEIGERKVKTGLEGGSKIESVKSWKASSGSERTESQSSKGGKVESSAAYKKN